MGQIRQFFQNLSLRKSIIVYITVFAFIGILLSAFTASSCNILKTRIRASYPMSTKKYYLTTEEGEHLGDGAYIGTDFPDLSKKDEMFVSLLEIIPVVATPIYSALCIMIAALLFYRNKLKRPLAELKAASEKISNNDLDFSISYENKDELGRLCASFEVMRSALANNFAGMWRQVEERKQLNAAFAHDLRTPLTVLKGYDEMLQTSSDRITQETAVTMGKHILRLERYVVSMSNLQRLEDAQPVYAEVLWQEFSAALEENAYILCSRGNKKLLFQNRVTSKQLILDRSFVSQVCNNLISNAIRYADTTVTLDVEETDEGLLLTVSDDGKGFSKETLVKAANPYFTEEKNHAEHFGLGLYICKLLCEHHGGYLKLKNLDNGAEAAAFFRSPNCR